MSKHPINLNEKLSQFTDHWAPRVIGELNDYQVKLVKLQGEFVWHAHDHTDELFLVLEGEMDIAFRDRTITLKQGELYVVPKGVEHKPSAKLECKVLLLEPRGVINTGETGGDKTAPNDVWI